MSQREITDHKALENHASAVLTSGQPPGSFGHQRVLAHTSIFVDLFIDGRIGVSPVWGPLVPFMEGHLVAVEFVSDWLSKKMLIRYIAEAQLLLHNEQEGDPGPDDGRLIIMCHDMPRARLAELAEHITPGPMPGKWMADLYALARIRLQKSGVTDIAGTSQCTVCLADDYYSYRQQQVTGRFATGIVKVS
jgi:hypothetical protein